MKVVRENMRVYVVWMKVQLGIVWGREEDIRIDVDPTCVGYLKAKIKKTA